MKERRVHSANVEYTLSTGLLTHNWKDCCKTKDSSFFQNSVEWNGSNTCTSLTETSSIKPHGLQFHSLRLTTCVLELWSKQEKVLGVLDVKWKIKKWASPLWSWLFLPKQRGRGRWSGRNRQKKKRIHTAVPLLHLPLLLTADYRKTGVYINATWHSNSSLCLNVFFSFISLCKIWCEVDCCMACKAVQSDRNVSMFQRGLLLLLH